MRFTHSKDRHTHIEIKANSNGSDSRFWSALLERRSTRRAALATAASALAATAILAACGDDDREPRRDARKPDGPGVVTSRDGTRIAYDRLGQGPAVIQVAGALGYRAHPIMAGLASALATHFTVFNYDRRGRGDSGDTPPYSVDREIEDIEALIQEAGGSAYLYGLSSGGVLALAAANELTTKVTKLALYEPPFIVDDGHPPLPRDYVQQINSFVALHRRDDAVALFMKVVGVPEEFIPQMHALPEWPQMEKVAHTLAYDGTIMGQNQSGRPLAPGQWPAVTAQTVVIVGGNSEAFFHTGAEALIEQVRTAHKRVLPGQGHDVHPDALAPLLTEFFQG